MEFNIKKTVLVEEVRMVNRAVENNPHFPILTNLLVKIDETGMSLTGSNGELTIETFYEIEEESELEVISSGAVTVPAKKFSDIIRSLPGQEVNVSMEDNNRVKIRSGKSRFTLVGEPSDSYPLLPKVEDSQSLKLSSGDFIDMLQTTGYAVSKSDTRPILMGVNLFFDGNRVGALSTDSHRLARAKGITFEGSGFEHSVTIPAKTVKELPSLLSKSKEIKVQTDGNQFIVHGEGVTTYTRIHEGNFPDTSRLIPDDFKTEVTVNRQEFLSSLQRVSILSHVSENSIVKLEIDQDSDSMFESILLSSNNQEIGSSREEVLIDKMEGEDLEISFNVHYMIEALRNIESEMICVGFVGAMRPFIITPLNSEVDTLKLILPVRTY